MNYISHSIWQIQETENRIVHVILFFDQNHIKWMFLCYFLRGEVILQIFHTIANNFYGGIFPVITFSTLITDRSLNRISCLYISIHIDDTSGMKLFDIVFSLLSNRVYPWIIAVHFRRILNEIFSLYGDRITDRILFFSFQQRSIPGS